MVPEDSVTILQGFHTQENTPEAYVFNPTPFSLSVSTNTNIHECLAPQLTFSPPDKPNVIDVSWFHEQCQRIQTRRVRKPQTVWSARSKEWDDIHT
jgi:hypothetical protein